MNNTTNNIDTKLSTPKAKIHKLSIASMILGILSFVGLGFLTSIPGLITGIISFIKIKKNTGLLAGRWCAITGIITSAVNLFFYIIVAILLLISIFISIFSSGLIERNPEGILINGRLSILPESVGKLPELQYLYLGKNPLTSLPKSFDYLRKKGCYIYLYELIPYAKVHEQ